MMGSLRGFAWNCEGLRRGVSSTLSKVMYFEKTFKNSFDFFFFIETHHKDENEIPNELMRYKDSHHIIDSKVEGEETHAGIIGLVRKEYEVNDVKHLIQGRILNFLITDSSKKSTHRISVVYLPTNRNLNLDIMTNIVHLLRPQHEDEVEKYMILGDFNFIDHEKDKKKWPKSEGQTAESNLDTFP